MYRHARVRTDCRRIARRWRVDLFDDHTGLPRRTRWFRRHAKALRWAVRMVGA